MSSSDIAEAAGVVVLIGLIFYLSRRFSIKQKVVAGIALFIVGRVALFSA